MSSDDKKLWEKPELTSFANADEAIAYYSERGMHEHVAAIRRMVEKARIEREKSEDPRLRTTARR